MVEKRRDFDKKKKRKSGKKIGDNKLKTAVITGSTRGLGYEMAKVFVNNGWNVVINGVNEGSL